MSMTTFDRMYEEVKRCDLELNHLLWDHGEDEIISGAVQHSASLLWYLDQLRRRTGGPGCDGAHEIPHGALGALGRDGEEEPDA